MSNNIISKTSNKFCHLAVWASCPYVFWIPHFERIRGFSRYIPKLMISFWNPKPGCATMDGSDSEALIIWKTMWSLMLDVMVSWGLACHKAGLISSIGVQCAPSVSSSQLLSYCCAQLGHFFLPCKTNPEHLALFSFSFKCITLSAGNGAMYTNWKVLKNVLYVFLTFGQRD